MLQILWLCFWICTITTSYSTSLNSTTITLLSKEGAGLCEVFYLPDCKPMECYWHNWKNRKITSNKIVLGYSHNGFGNQLFQNSFAFGVAGALGAKVYIAKIDQPLFLPPGGTVSPPNTHTAYKLMQQILPQEFAYDLLPKDSYIKRLCTAEPYYLSDRPYETKRGSLNENSRHELEIILSDPEPRCIRLCGYWQVPQICWADAKEIWSLHKAIGNIGNVNLSTIISGQYDTEKTRKVLLKFKHKDTLTSTVVNITEVKMTSSDKEDRIVTYQNLTTVEYRTKTPNFSKLPVKPIKKDILEKLLQNTTLHTEFKSIIENQTMPGPGDICVYLRCLPIHYYFNHELFYDMIFNNTNYDDIWIFENPYCRSSFRLKIDLLLKYMYDKRHAKR